MFLKKSTVQEYLPKTIAHVAEAFERSKVTDSWSAMNVLMDCGIEQDLLNPMADFTHGPEECYGRKILHKSKTFEVILMMWKPGDVSAIHQHGTASWGAVKTYGQMDYASFTLDDNKLRTSGMIRLNERNIVAVDGNVIYQMGNSTDQNVFTLHIYGVNEASDMPGIMRDSRIFDLSSGKSYKTDAKAFYELPASAIKKIETGLSADYPTWLSNLTHQINRNKKMAQFSRLKFLLNELRSTEKAGPLLEFLEGKLEPSGRFINKFYEKMFTSALISLGTFLGEFPEYHPLQQISVQLDRSKTIVIVHVDDRQIMLDYSSDKLVIS